MVWSTFFYQCIPGDVRACQDGLEHFFSTFVHLTERGGEDDLGNAHIEPSHFKKGLPFPKNIPFSSILGTFKDLLGWFGAFFFA